MSQSNNLKVPFSSKVWWVLTWIVMIILLVMVGRNFIGSIVFGPDTGKSEITSYYDIGLADGVSGEKRIETEFKTENPLLIKAYSKGLREGLDKKWQDQEK